MVDVDISIRSTEGQDDTQPMLLWDTVWNADASVLDWALAGTGDPSNVLGLEALRALDTAILIQLGTHKRAPPYLPLPAGTDPKGWWGDTVDLEDNETQIGSLLWTLYRSILSTAVAQKAVGYVQDCLQPLITQGAVATFDVTYTMDAVKGFLSLNVNGYSQDGQRIYSQQFNRLWQQEFAAIGATYMPGLDFPPYPSQASNGIGCFAIGESSIG